MKGIEMHGVETHETKGRQVLLSLEQVAKERGAPEAEAKIAELRAFLADDLRGVESDLRGFDRVDTPMHQSAVHLLSGRGKLLRPMCVALAARVGSGFSPVARQLAVAAELVHSATLLHDDVVDSGDQRRGTPAARVLYGNAASIFAGDWLLVEALTRVSQCHMPDVLARALEVLGQMLEAEALQLARRGKIRAERREYDLIVKGKTASLFRWAMFAGARAGGLDESATKALEIYGERIGIAFQLVDDTLDLDGNEATLGKGMFADLREGKMTFPLLVAVERDEDLRAHLEEVVGEGGELIGNDTVVRVRRALAATGAIDEAKKWAKTLTDGAIEALAEVPASNARGALETVARAVIARRK